MIKGKRHPTLEDNVLVGAGAKVLGPKTLGKISKHWCQCRWCLHSIP